MHADTTKQTTAAKQAKASDPVKCRELPKTHAQRKVKGYRWIVETRIGGKRGRKFFRHDEAEERDKFITDETARVSAVAKSDRALVTDEALLTEAAQAHKALHPHGKSLSDAVSFYVRHLEAMAKHDATTISTVVKRFLDEKEREGISEVHRTDLKNRIARFEISFGKTPIGSIHRNDIAAWLNDLPLAPQSKINFRRILGNLFSYAVRAGNIEVNPVLATSPPKSRRKRAVILTPVEVEKLLNSSTADTVPALVLMSFCGIRNRELFRLSWSCVDWEDSTIEISAEEGKREGHARHVSIPANALEWLRPYAKKRGKIADFKDFDEYTRRLQDARALAGWAVGDWPANALRKTFISCHYETHGSIDETAKQAGTSAAMIHAHYRKLIKKKEAEKLWEILPTNGPANLLPFKSTAAQKAAEKWPNPEKLQAMLWEKPLVEIAKEIGVTDKAVEKHATKHGLTRPPRGYWLKQSTQAAAK
jgi:integrase